ncbi:YbbR-like domain-containing protein [Planococcus dechangensis]|uniref:YbbR-like domain-containing protein n=1 Tax=Planococcus dechangensis TaxID=1176255 RepID=A0ABV9M9P0_9BACL
MDKMMDNPWFLRIMALFLAFLLFFSVQAENNSTTTTETGRVSEMIEDVELQVYYDDSLMVSGVPETVDLYLSGPASIIQTTRQLDDYTLFIDLRSLPLGEHQVPIQTENLSEQLSARVDPAFVNIVLEERVSQEFEIDAEMNERLLAEGFVLDGLEVEPDTVTVTGPQSVIGAISFVKATVTGEPGINESFTAEARVRVLAEDLTKLDNVTIEPESVEVDVTVEEYSRELPVRIEANGEPLSGITINSWTPSSEQVRVFGPRSVLDAMEEYVVEVEANSITAEDTTVTVELPIPSGASGVSPGEMQLEADISVDESAIVPDELENPEIVDNDSE